MRIPHYTHQSLSWGIYSCLLAVGTDFAYCSGVKSATLIFYIISNLHIKTAIIILLLSIHPSIHAFTHLLIHSFIHSFIFISHFILIMAVVDLKPIP